MTRGKPWDINEERQLRLLVEEGKTVDTICKVMIKTRDAVIQKMFDLKLKNVKEKRISISGKKTIFSSSQLAIPDELPTIEETLKILAAALLKSTEAGLSKEEVGRLQVVATLAKTYKEDFADYIDYRGIEQRLAAVEAKYDALEKRSPNFQPKPS